jgi:type VI secretion system protein ImpF
MAISQLPSLVPLFVRLVAGEDALPTTGAGILALRESVRRDLEALLNTRRPPLSWPVALKELDGSILAYGIGDIAGRHFEAAAERSAFCTEVASAIARFDSRLKAVSVRLTEESPGRGFGLVIEAVLDTDQLPLALTFGTKLDPALQRMSVEEILS